MTAPEHPPPERPAIVVRNEAGRSPVVLTCEHAANFIPARYARLGLPPQELERHIAWDAGAAALAEALSQALDAPLFLGTHSRLLIDLNRPAGVASSIPLRSEATDIPGNRDLAADERRWREQALLAPYHARIASFLDRRSGPTLLVAIHSFTPVYLGERRPWHAGILYGAAAAFGEAVAATLAREPGLTVGTNVPYRITREGDTTIPVHGDDRGVPAILVEIRNDLLGDATAVARWCARLAGALKEWSAREPAHAAGGQR
jgi:predicted N-formylglutamate amidohydrolase